MFIPINIITNANQLKTFLFGKAELREIFKIFRKILLKTIIKEDGLAFINRRGALFLRGILILEIITCVLLE